MVLIKKKSGDKEQFSKDKLKYSLMYAGASKELAAQISDEIYGKCFAGMSTRKIYSLAFAKLKKISRSLASHYSIRKALLELGPDGYHFEKFIASLFESKGYKVEVNQTKKGRCVNHEVDVIARKNGDVHYCECKFHNRSGIKNDLKVALYVKARADDLKENPDNKLTKFWLISNTKFSKDAIEYSECSKLRLLGPTYPKDSSLLVWIKETRNHPVTCLTTLKKMDLKKVLKQGIVNIDEMVKHRETLESIGFSENEINKMFWEIKELKKVHV
jgi:Holliday junction resolvase-like predicted endonuclease